MCSLLHANTKSISSSFSPSQTGIFFSVWYMLEVEMLTVSQPNSPEIVWSGCVKVATE